MTVAAKVEGAKGLRHQINRNPETVGKFQNIQKIVANLVIPVRTQRVSTDVHNEVSIAVDCLSLQQFRAAAQQCDHPPQRIMLAAGEF